MDTYANISINEYTISSSKNNINPYLMIIFVESEKLRSIEKDKNIFDDEPVEEIITWKYITSVAKAIDRLEIIGYTLDKIKKSYKISYTDSIDKFLEKRFHSTLSKTLNEILEEGKIRKKLKDLTVDDFIEAFKQLKENQIDLIALKNSRIPNKGISFLANYILAYSSGKETFDYPDNNQRCYLRCILEAFDPSDVISLDLTWLDLAETLDCKGEIRNDSINELNKNIAENSKILILTEGKTDKEILERSLRLRYPHLVDYYLFMPFHFGELDEKHEIESSASLLVKRIESFVACCINNRVIGLLDNDKAGIEAESKINKKNLPSNIKLIHYPDISLANEYPAHDKQTNDQPSTTMCNINGKAASIEIYYGNDILTEENNLIPIQWTEKKDQGNFQKNKKKQLFKKMQEKLSICEKDHTKINNYDWSGIDAIFKALFRCFQE
ncbi:hypothetical protein J9253_13570 [Thiothrix litoralis]|uniref:HEPN/Toprim N-terminal domain-containing protein n=1 Tax=Thiothrix litoralis TaxID=2891210 RepID=A0ABX7WN86_9GAMM|nr:HEPN/Toprim-associated domain-containing protein [Thiothrix litoralis]QTR45034.1 hypothetical protein J9253_13570 [Thiothrix litoralis]